MTNTDFKDLFDNHFDAVRNYIYYRSGDPELATDIAQEAFLKIWEKQISFDNREKAAGLLFKISRDLFISSYRRQKVIDKFNLSLSDSISYQTPDEKIEYEELKNKYEKSLKKLPEKQRVVFLMSRIDNMKYHQIAVATGIGVKAVEKRMRNALLFLKQELVY